jgi:hypothetical protein
LMIHLRHAAAAIASGLVMHGESGRSGGGRAGPQVAKRPRALSPVLSSYPSPPKYASVELIHRTTA